MSKKPNPRRRRKKSPAPCRNKSNGSSGRRKKKSPPPTPAQKEARDNFSLVSRAWKLLDHEKRKYWHAAIRIFAQRKNPETGFSALIRIPHGGISAYNAFELANLLARSVGQTVFIEIPVLGTKPPEKPRLTALWDGSKLIITWEDAYKVYPSHRVRVWLGSDERLFHTQIAGVAPVSDKRMEISEVKGKNDKMLMKPRKRIYHKN